MVESIFREGDKIKIEVRNDRWHIEIARGPNEENQTGGFVSAGSLHETPEAALAQLRSALERTV